MVSSVPELSKWLEEHAVMHELVKQHLLRAQSRMKRHADKNRSERTFSIGDWVYIKLHPYVQSSLAPRSNQKLAFKYFGLYRVAAHVGSCSSSSWLCGLQNGVACVICSSPSLPCVPVEAAH